METPSRRESGTVALAALLGAGVLARTALGTSGAFVGQPIGEGFGRLFVLAQVRRWMTGDAPWGHADLLAWPDGVPFWPVDPVLAFPTAVLGALIGDPLALTLSIIGLVALAGWGTWLLARVLGAGPWGGLAAGVLAETQPLLWRHAADTITEVCAMGFVALALVAVLASLRGRHLAWVLGGGVLLGGSSPYFGAYVGIGFALVTPWLLYRYRLRAISVGAALAIGLGLAAAPLFAMESYEGGRLDYRGGFSPAPKGWYIPLENGVEPVRRLRPPDAGLKVVDQVPGLGPEPPRLTPDLAPPPPRWHRFAQAAPGGVACLLAVVFGLVVRRSRGWATLALMVLILGPGPPQFARMLRVSVRWQPPLQQLLHLVPGGDRLGNQARWLLIYGVLAAVGGGLAVRRKGALVLTAAGLIGGVAHQGDLAFPATRTPDLNSLDAGAGPLLVFPSGDGPFWHPGVPPKLVHHVAASLGAALPEDYGRGENAAWAQALRVELSRIGRVPCGSAMTDEPPTDLPDNLAVLVLDPLLHDASAAAIHENLSARFGPPAATNNWGTLWLAKDP